MQRFERPRVSGTQACSGMCAALEFGIARGRLFSNGWSVSISSLAAAYIRALYRHSVDYARAAAGQQSAGITSNWFCFWWRCRCLLWSAGNINGSARCHGTGSARRRRPPLGCLRFQCCCVKGARARICIDEVHRRRALRGRMLSVMREDASLDTIVYLTHLLFFTAKNTF